MGLTKTQYEKLVESAVEAKHYLVCQYGTKTEPLCVIGQFAARCGEDVSEFRGTVANVLNAGRWDGAGVEGELLNALQFIWDTGKALDTSPNPEHFTEDEARLAMLFEIEAAR